MIGRTKESSRHIEVVLKTLDVLDCFLDEPALNLKQIVKRTGLTHSRVMRITGTLESRGYLIHQKESNRYSLGPRLRALGRAFEQNNALVSLSRQVLKKLSQRTGESSVFFVRDGFERLVLAREQGTHTIRYWASEGERMELHAGAGGKVLLAFGPPEVTREVLMKRQLRRLTPQTIVNPDELRAELDRIRARGYAYSLGERADGAGSISAPVFDDENRLVGALAIAGPVNRFSSEMREANLNAVLEAARELSSSLGWKGGAWLDTARE